MIKQYQILILHFQVIRKLSKVFDNILRIVIYYFLPAKILGYPSLKKPIASTRISMYLDERFISIASSCVFPRFNMNTHECGVYWRNMLNPIFALLWNMLLPGDTNHWFYTYVSDAELLSTSSLGLMQKIEYNTFCSASFFIRFNLIISLHYSVPLIEVDRRKYYVEFLSK